MKARPHGPESNKSPAIPAFPGGSDPNAPMTNRALTQLLPVERVG